MSDIVERAGWEVEGFINRLTRRTDVNSERLVLEAISHLRGFSRDCDALRDNLEEARAEIERLTRRHKDLWRDFEAQVNEIERLWVENEQLRKRLATISPVGTSGNFMGA